MGGGRQFTRLLAAEVCASAVVMLDTPCSEIVCRVLATHSIRQFPLHFPTPCVTVCHHISTGLYTVYMYIALHYAHTVYVSCDTTSKSRLSALTVLTYDVGGLCI